MRARISAAALGTILLVAIPFLTSCSRNLKRTEQAPLPPLPAGVTTIVAVGDIACNPNSAEFNSGKGTKKGCQQEATAELAAKQDPRYVVLLGDTQYEEGRRAAYDQSFDKSWGRFRDRWLPAVGNHEYRTANATGYFDYFGTAAGDPKQGWYSRDVGKWHIIILNSECSHVGGCEKGSPQEKWLEQDLASTKANCILAAFHEPRFSSGLHGNNGAYLDFWNDLYQAGADVVLNGHDHDYEALAPMTPDGHLDSEHGIHEFIVGTGGKNHRGYLRLTPNSVVRDDRDFGVLRLDLQDDRYRWTFLNIAGESVDTGEAKCHTKSR